MGDDVLEKTANTLCKLLNQHIFNASKPELFIYKEYHVEAFHDSELKPTYRNIMRKVRNNLTQAMNKFPMVLPNYLIIMISNSYAHDPAFMDFEFKTILKRVLNDVSRLLACKREQIPRKAQNLFTTTEVFVTRPLPKPATVLKGDKMFKSARRNINTILDKLSRTFDFKPLNIDEINCSQRALFEKTGELSDFGQERLWHSISEFIKTRDSCKMRTMCKFEAAKQDSATQVDERDFEKPRNGDQQGNYASVRSREEPEEYFTQEGSARGWQDRERRPDGHGQFDYYHRSYDRDDYASRRNIDYYHEF